MGTPSKVKVKDHPIELRSDAPSRFDYYKQAAEEGEHMDDVDCWSRAAAQMQTERDTLLAQNRELVEALEEIARGRAGPTACKQIASTVLAKLGKGKS